MRAFVRRRPWASLVGAIGLAGTVAMVGMALYLASLAGELPWQSDPTRIPVTPFAGIEGFDAPDFISAVKAATPAAAGTPVPEIDQ